MMQWSELLQRITQAGVACPPLTGAAVDALPLDIAQPAAELLAKGWPAQQLHIGTCRWGGPIGELLAGLPVDWPRHLLPMARRGGEALGWDPRTNQVVVVGGGQGLEVTGPLAASLAVVAGWLQHGHGRETWGTPGHAALPSAEYEALRAEVGGVAMDSWLLRGVCEVPALRRVLGQQRRQAMATARWTSVVVGLAPVLGWVGGTLLNPPRPALAGTLALLVVGGAPSVLMAVAMRRAVQLAQQLERLPRDSTPPPR